MVEDKSVDIGIAYRATRALNEEIERHLDRAIAVGERLLNRGSPLLAECQKHTNRITDMCLRTANKMRQLEDAYDVALLEKTCLDIYDRIDDLFAKF